MRFPKSILFAFLSALVFTASSSAGEKINWMITEEPPFTYVEGGRYGGYGIEILGLLSGHMPSYSHRISLAGNYARLTKEIEEGPLTCALGLFKTPARQETMHFSSTPVLYFFNMQIVMTRALYLGLGSPESLSLDEMLQDESLTLGISKGRTYFKKLRTILVKYEGRPNIYVGPQSDVAESLLKMLLRERFDYMLLYPEEASFLMRKMGEGEIITVPIKEIFPLGYSWVACTKNEGGLKAIGEIGKALKEEKPTSKYRSLFEEWFGANLLPLFRGNYEKEFLSIEE